MAKPHNTISNGQCLWRPTTPGPQTCCITEQDNITKWSWLKRTHLRMNAISLTYLVNPTHSMHWTPGETCKLYNAAIKHDMMTAPLQTLSLPSLPGICLRLVQSSFHSSLGPYGFFLINKWGPKPNGWIFLCYTQSFQTGIIQTITFSQHQMQSHYCLERKHHWVSSSPVENFYFRMICRNAVSEISSHSVFCHRTLPLHDLFSRNQNLCEVTDGYEQQSFQMT